MMNAITCIVGALVLTTTAAAQSIEVFIPDDRPDQGACTAAPFTLTDGSAEWIVPAAALGTTAGLIEEIAFAPCGSGPFTTVSFQAMMGHLPANFVGGSPTIIDGIVALPGGFSEAACLHDSDVDGPWSMSFTQDQWSPLGFSTRPHGTGFVWDGVRDVGLMITWQGGAGGVGIHTAPGNPTVAVASGYQGLFGTTFYAGGRMRLTIRPLAAAPGVQTVGSACVVQFPPDIHTTNLPFLGQQRLGVTIRSPFNTNPSLLFLAATVAAAPWPLGAPPYQCTGYLDLPSAMDFLAQGIGPFPSTNSGSTGRWVFSIPNDPSLQGASIALQAVRPWPWVGQWDASNALVLVIN